MHAFLTNVSTTDPARQDEHDCQYKWTVGGLSDILYLGANFRDFLFAFVHSNPPSEKGAYSFLIE